MTVFEKAKRAAMENYSPEEIYNGIAFMYYCELITLDEYNILMDIVKANNPDY